MPKREFRGDWESRAIRPAPIDPALEEKMLQLIREEYGPSRVAAIGKQALMAIRIYGALSQTGWQRPPPSIVKRQLVRFLARLNKVMARGNTPAAIDFLRRADEEQPVLPGTWRRKKPPQKLPDALKLSSVIVVKENRKPRIISLQTMLYRIDRAVRTNRMSYASRRIEALPNFVQSIIDAIPVKKGARRFNHPGIGFIQNLNRAWHGLLGRADRPTDFDDEIERRINGQHKLKKRKREFFQACFALAGEDLSVQDTIDLWKEYEGSIDWTPRVVAPQ